MQEVGYVSILLAIVFQIEVIVIELFLQYGFCDGTRACEMFIYLFIFNFLAHLKC